MIVSINQPAYLPWLGYFDRIARSDLHIVLDHVQFEKNSFTNRNKVRTARGWAWLTVPVKTRGRFGQLAINEIEIANNASWRRKHWESLRLGYAGTPYFGEHEDFFDALYAREWPRLDELLRETTRHLLEVLGIRTRLARSSERPVPGVKEQLVINLCRSAGATAYLSGPLGRHYLDPAMFREAGIELLFHDYRHPEYDQIHPGFEPYMSVVDLLFNHGPESLRVLTEGQELTRP